MVATPTDATAKSPTIFTCVTNPSPNPVIASQNHQDKENGLI